MRELFSRELLADIHIRFDKEGLQGLSEKELSVLLSETISNSAIFVVDQINGHAEVQTGRLIEHSDTQTDRLVEHIDAQTEKLMKHAELQTDRLVEHIDAQTDRLVQHIDAQTQQLMKHSEIQTDRILYKIDEAVQPFHKELAYFRFWTKILVGGVWAVVASLIASILFQFLTK